MWIKRDRFEHLIRTEAMADMLVARVNQLEREKAALEFRLTGVPVAVPEIASLGKPQVPVKAHANPNSPSPEGFEHIKSLLEGNAFFQDMGDADAHKHGIRTDDEGRLIEA
jgi:hypothetical protein